MFLVQSAGSAGGDGALSVWGFGGEEVVRRLLVGDPSSSRMVIPEDSSFL